jgi:AmiR/NasT family two-component response regulator
MSTTGSSEHPPGEPISALRIIVADDDERMREFYREVLTRMGHVVVGAAGDGRALVETCLEEEADLVVTDIRMPELDGIQAAQIVSHHVELPFLFVSAFYDDSLIDEASKAFSYGYLVKPIKQQDLAASIPVAMRRFWERPTA